MHLKDICNEAHATSVSKGWYDDPETGLVMRLNVGMRIALVHSELSEALEVWRDGKMFLDTILVRNGKPEGFGIELADAVIRICDLAAAEGIDLEHCVIEKMAYNKTRPHRHGGKAA